MSNRFYRLIFGAIHFQQGDLCLGGTGGDFGLGIADAVGGFIDTDGGDGILFR